MSERQTFHVMFVHHDKKTFNEPLRRQNGRLRRSSDPVISARGISTKMDPINNEAGASLGGNDWVIAEATSENGCEASKTVNSSSMQGDASCTVVLV